MAKQSLYNLYKRWKDVKRTYSLKLQEQEKERVRLEQAAVTAKTREPESTAELVVEQQKEKGEKAA